MASYTYLIIGGGMTADAAADGIRAADPGGSIGLISSEADAPYNRPPLTKGLWKGEPLESVWRNTPDKGVELKLNRRITALDVTSKTARDSEGRHYSYEKLLLATGGTPRHLPFPAGDTLYYRTLADYRRLRAADRSGRFVVIGGGFIGTEIAAALRINDRDVVLIVPEAGLGARVYPQDLARFLADYYRDKGVDVRLGASVAAITSRDRESTVRLTSGEEISASIVIAGLGITPNTELAEQAGLRVDDGIVVDQTLRTSSPNVYAAGDVARFHNPALDMRWRVEHEDNALSMGRCAGLNMAGRTESYNHLPFFYSDLFDLGYEAVGQLDARLDTLADWKHPYREGVIYYLKKGRVCGVLLWNTWNQVDAARVLIAEPGPFGPQDLKGRLPA